MPRGPSFCDAPSALELFPAQRRPSASGSAQALQGILKLRKIDCNCNGACVVTSRSKTLLILNNRRAGAVP